LDQDDLTTKLIVVGANGVSAFQGLKYDVMIQIHES
jgi:hypothetical protein